MTGLRQPDLVVLDAGKQGLEHFEFNRGLLLALRKAELPFRFVAMRSMVDVHAEFVDLQSCRSFESHGMGLPKRWKLAVFKLFSVWMSFVAILLAPRCLLVLYATPAAHLALALLSRVIRRDLVIFLHAEIEFLARGEGKAHMVGEHLMRLALRCASRRVRYLGFTAPAAECIGRIHGTQATVFPHPMSPDLLGSGPAWRPPRCARSRRATALVFFKGPSASAGLQELCEAVGRSMPINVNGSVCTLLTGVPVWPWIEPLRALRTFLERQQLEVALAETDVYVLAAGEDEYCFTASGLACSAASVGAVVVGCANPFMREYQARYPAHFKVLFAMQDADVSVPQRPGSALDNIADVVAALWACLSTASL